MQFHTVLLALDFVGQVVFFIKKFSLGKLGIWKLWDFWVCGCQELYCIAIQYLVHTLKIIWEICHVRGNASVVEQFLLRFMVLVATFSQKAWMLLVPRPTVIKLHVEVRSLQN